MDEIISFVKNVVPSVDEKELENAFNTVGVVKLEDLQDISFVTDEEFKSVLKLVQARQLQKAVNATFNLSNTDNTPTTNTPSASSPVTPRTTSFTMPSTTSSPLSDFILPIEKFSTQLRTKMERNIKATTTEENEVANIIAKEILCINTHPGTHFLSRVAVNLVKLYPNTFAVHHSDDNSIVGEGHDLMFRKLKEKMKNLNRTRKRQLFRDEEENDKNDDENSSQRPKRIANTQKEKYGTQNFLPMDLPDGETFSTQKVKRQWLKEEFVKSERERDHAKIKQYMEITYTSQRMDITDKSMSTNILRSEWPFLFEKEHLLRHFCQLMGFDLFERAREVEQQHLPILFSFLKSQVGRTEQDPEKLPSSISALRDIFIKKRNTSFSCVEEQFPFAVAMLMAWWKQPSELLIKLYSDTHNVAEVEATSSISHPHVAVFGDSLLTCSQCIPVFENNTISGIETAEEALLIAMALYFVYGVEYPPRLAPILEYLQRMILKIDGGNSTKVKRVKGQPPSKNSRVLTLIAGLEKHRLLWN